jgi:hypothetical protein
LSPEWRYWRSQPQAGVDGELDGATDGDGAAGVAAGVAVEEVSLVAVVLVEGVVLDEPPRLSVL